MIGSRPLTKDDYVTIPVGPPSAADEPGLALENGWLMGQSGDRRVTSEEREALYWAMGPCGQFRMDMSIEQKLDAGYVRLRNWHASYAVRFRVQFKSGTIDDDTLRYYGVDEASALEFFEGRLNWWWFLGDQILQIGKYHVNDPTRVTMGEEPPYGATT